ncbi:MAG: hypothetical protein CMQ38_11400 [Gammaproteobacteria bacterium]|nr:hypothetical protein [Gammaproteobacteria bacterium]
MEQLYPYLIIIGSSILIAAGWLLYSYRTQILLSQKLIRLNEELNYDLPDFLRQCWPSLKESGFAGLSWSLNWFGTYVSGSNGKTDGRMLEKRFDVQEITLTVCLYLHQRSWEYRFISSALADNFFLLVRMNLWVKLGAVRSTFEQTAKMTVFLQHDVKNMAQLMKLTAEQLNNPVPGQEDKLIDSMREVIPAVRDRAEHMLNTLTNKSADNLESSHDLNALLEQTANMYELPSTINGETTTVKLPKNNLQSILDNILGNFSRQANKSSAQKPDVHIDLEREDDFVKVTITDKNGAPCLWPERLFEPFWSEFGTGRGIGLYQARQHAYAAGGSLTAESMANTPLIFVLKLPA